MAARHTSSGGPQLRKAESVQAEMSALRRRVRQLEAEEARVAREAVSTAGRRWGIIAVGRLPLNDNR